MGHRVIIIDSVTPTALAASELDHSEPEFKVRIEYRPGDVMTPAQIGNEIARIQRRVNQIIEGTAD